MSKLASSNRDIKVGNMGRLIRIVPFLVFCVLVFFAAQAIVSNDNDETDLSNETCLECHETIEIDSAEVDLAKRLGASIHKGLQCIDCHSDITASPHEEEKLAPVDCGSCHTTEAEIYQMHGRVKIGEDEDIPSCADCHGSHDIIPSKQRNSAVSPENLPKTCGNCHENIDLTTKHEILYGKAVSVYKSSVHGKAITGGVDLAASCNDCHSSNGSAHRIYGPGNAQSTINHFNIPKTCGNCHGIIEEEFWNGIHGKLVERGETDAPVCTHCHGEHGIISPSDPRSAVSPARLAEATCSPCHESAYLNEKYGIPTGRLRSWYDSYHGLKSRAGDVTVANCASCHGTHLILPQSDPKSSIHPNNLEQTCGTCHPGISAEMATTAIHETPGIATPAALVVKNLYIIIIVIVIGAMFVHWLIDFRKQIHRLRSKKQVQRMTQNEVWQHWFLMITFIVLVISGFSLRYSESWWVNLLFGWEGGFPVRGIIHRVAAILFSVTAIWHLIFIFGKRGRQFLKDISPSVKDIKELYQMVAYNLGTKKSRPIFGRFSYIEKAEYWSLVWGTAIMIITGFFLWFEDAAIQWFPKGFLDVMLVIHFYEAWLALLAILIWHLYSTVFNPSVYPMNPSWIDGKMPLEQHLHEHPADSTVSATESPNATDSPGRATPPSISDAQDK